MDRRRFLVTAGTAATLGLSGCVSGFSGESGEYDVGMAPSAFDPVEVTIDVGDTLVWQNTTGRSHTVTAYENGIPEKAEFFASGGYETEDAARRAWEEDFGGRLTTDEQFEHTFEVPGTYQYFCIPHEQGGMRATVIVEE